AGRNLNLLGLGQSAIRAPRIPQPHQGIPIGRVWQNNAGPEGAIQSDAAYVGDSKIDGGLANVGGGTE
ncbi:MAG: hypothetical protein WA863_04545, partial [Methyloceanibacter sp.]